MLSRLHLGAENQAPIIAPNSNGDDTRRRASVAASFAERCSGEIYVSKTPGLA
jgi:hypothetical protein